MGIPRIGQRFVQDGLIDVALLPGNQPSQQTGCSMEDADLSNRSGTGRRFKVTDACSKDLLQALISAQEWAGTANNTVCSKHPLLHF
jgi:hypothetical protein